MLCCNQPEIPGSTLQGLQILNLSFKLFPEEGLERLFTEKKNQENERRGIDFCGNGELIQINLKMFYLLVYFTLLLTSDT